MRCCSNSKRSVAWTWWWCEASVKNATKQRPTVPPPPPPHRLAFWDIGRVTGHWTLCLFLSVLLYIKNYIHLCREIHIFFELNGITQEKLVYITSHQTKNVTNPSISNFIWTCTRSLLTFVSCK